MLSSSVRHKEIPHLLANGVTVIGCSSMGALRAAELHPQDLTGSGQVFAMYGDDEVAVPHDEAPRYHRSRKPSRLAGWLFGIAAAVPFLVDALSFVLAGALAVGVRDGRSRA